MTNEEALSMNPMSMDSTEEDDVLLAAWYKARCYTRTKFPDPTSLIKH